MSVETLMTRQLLDAVAEKLGYRLVPKMAITPEEALPLERSPKVALLGTLFSKEDEGKIMRARSKRLKMGLNWNGKAPEPRELSRRFISGLLHQMLSYHGRWVIVTASAHNLSRVGFARMMLPHTGNPFHSPGGLDIYKTLGPPQDRSLTSLAEVCPARLLVSYSRQDDQGPNGDSPFKLGRDFSCLPLNRIRLATADDFGCALERDTTLRTLPMRLPPVIGDHDEPPSSMVTTYSNETYETLRAAVMKDWKAQMARPSGLYERLPPLALASG